MLLYILNKQSLSIKQAIVMLYTANISVERFNSLHTKKILLHGNTNLFT